MISYEDCLNYIENIMPNYHDSLMNFKVKPIKNIKLADCQKRLLKNLIDGKITDCPRGMGKTLVIQLYADYLNYVHDMNKYDENIANDDYISGLECYDSPLDLRVIKNELYKNKELAMKKYNISEKEVSELIITNCEDFNLGI